MRLGLLAWCAVPGCVWSRHNCNDIPCGAIPPCTGTHTKEIMRTQAEIAEADDFTMYEHEWLYDPITHSGTAKPGPYGMYHLGEMVKRLPEVPFPVLIQVSLDDKLNEDRRVMVVQYLTANGIAEAERRVCLGFPAAEGLFGDEACGIYYRGFINPYQSGFGGYGGYRGGLIGGYGVSSFGVSGINGLGGLGLLGLGRF